MAKEYIKTYGKYQIIVPWPNFTMKIMKYCNVPSEYDDMKWQEREFIITQVPNNDNYDLFYENTLPEIRCG